MFTIALALLACEPDATTSADIYVDDTTPYQYLVTPVTPPVDCDDAEYTDGLTLVGLTPGATVVVSLVDGDNVYTETIKVDRCGTATPFSEMSLDDFGHFDELSSVYALVLEDPGYYMYQGIFLTAEPNAPPETPISTQWELVADDQWVAIRDDDFGVLIGLFMIP